MKSKRLQDINELISNHAIETQTELLEKLTEMGYSVTQATISRDINELGLLKVQDNDGTVRYIKPATQSIINNTSKLFSIFVDTVISVDYAMNLCVIKCYSGMGNAACSAIDSMQFSGVVGTIAGDDTIFVCMRNEQLAKELVDRLIKILND